MTDPAAIARKLSPAQREAIISAREILFGYRFLLSTNLRAVTIDKLRVLGLAEFHDIYRDRLTDTGLQVRALLNADAGGRG